MAARSERRLVVGMGLVALACSPNTGSLGSGSGGTPVGDGTTSAELTEGTTGMADGNGSDPATTMPLDGTSDDGPMETTGDEGPGQESSSGDPPGLQEVLENHDFAGCNSPVWCFFDDDFAMGVWEQQQWMQECFTATLPPPFELQQLEIELFGVVGAPTDVRVQVYARNGAAGPGALLAEQSISAASLVPGMNTIPLEPPLVLDQQEICIGLASPSPGGAIGISVNHLSLIDDVSFFRLDRGFPCVASSWTDIIGGGTTAVGNWCIRGTIESQ